VFLNDCLGDKPQCNKNERWNNNDIVKVMGKMEQMDEMFHGKTKKRFCCNINCNLTFPVFTPL
jgi:hypothetical protein